MQGTAMVRRVQTLGREQTSERRSLGEAHLAEVAQLEATVGKMREELAAKQHADARALLAKQHQALGMPLPRARDHPRSPEISPGAAGATAAATAAPAWDASDAEMEEAQTMAYAPATEAAAAGGATAGTEAEAAAAEEEEEEEGEEEEAEEEEASQPAPAANSQPKKPRRRGVVLSDDESD